MARKKDELWARLRFGVVGHLLASPPASGDLRAQLLRLSRMEWKHPTSGEPTRFGLSTIERWYYAARGASDPVSVLQRRSRRDEGRRPAISPAMAEVVRQQHAQYSTWSVVLHRDNLAVRIEREPDLGPLPSYATLRRFMAERGLRRERRNRGRPGEIEARARVAQREVRSFESEYVSGLWHLDFHHGSARVLAPNGEWKRPIILTVLDDRSRLVCHAQWYLDETAETLIHGLGQAFLKRGLPRSLLHDNGAAMTARETTEGLLRLSVLQQATLPYSPHQNGKQESFWNQVEGRLVAMLQGHTELTLAILNEATQAWVEMEYNRRVHSQTGQSPIERWLAGPSVAREAPTVEQLRLAFTLAATRKQRSSDGTASIEGIRFEIPSRFRHIPKLHVRYATWDLSRVWLVDERTDVVLARLYPLDKVRNADGFRRPVSVDASPEPVAEDRPPVAPLLRELMAAYAATGLPPAYVPKEDE